MSVESQATAARQIDASIRDSSRKGVSRGGLLRAAPSALRTGSYVLIALFTVMSAVLMLVTVANESLLGFDFRGTLWEPALAVRQGNFTYPAAVESELQVGNPAIYPPFLIVSAMPLTLLPWWLALTAWTFVGVASILGALYLLGVRDLRCYGIVLVCAPTIVGLAWGNATLVLVPLVALGWRWRTHAYRVGAVLGVAIAAKLILWPLVFWLLGTRRYRAATTTFVVGLAALIVPWAAVGFSGLTSYPDLLRVAGDVYATHSFSLATVLSAIGVEAASARSVTITVGVLLAVLAFAFGRRVTDEAAFSVAVLAAVLGSVIVWPYYFALLLVPIAIVRPRFSGMWAAVGLLYIAHYLPRPWLDAEDAGSGGVACCPPDGVPLQVWFMSHAPAGLWPALFYALLATALLAFIVVASRPARDLTPKAAIRP